MDSYNQREEKFAGGHPPFDASPCVLGWMTHAIRSLFSPVVLSLLALVVGVTSASEARTSRPLLSVRADHMVLDLVIYRDQLLVGTQSGRQGLPEHRRGVRRALQLQYVPHGPGEQRKDTEQSIRLGSKENEEIVSVNWTPQEKSIPTCRRGGDSGRNKRPPVDRE